MDIQGFNNEETFNKYYRGHHHGLFFWLRNSRMIALPQSLLPALLAVAVCWNSPTFTWWIAVLAVLGVCIGHLGMNLADDYYDFSRDSRIRSTLSQTSVRARMDKCTYITNGDATPKDLFRVMWIFLGVAGLLGASCALAQWWLHGFQSALNIAVYAVLGLLVGISYSGRPLQLCMYGLGELVIGLMFGPLLMLGLQSACCGVAFSWPMAVLSLAVGLLVTNILFVHSVMEVAADGELDKMTFARLLLNIENRHGWQKRRLELTFVGLFAVLPFVLIGLGIVMDWWSAWYLLTLLTFPMAVYLIVSLSRFVQGLPTNDNPRWWMGPMPEFAIYKEAGMDWFLIRWLLARNIVMYWCLILIIVEIFV